MALPVPDKTWQFNVNQIVPAQANSLTTNRRVLRLIKNTLIGFGSSPWTVSGSSNSTSAGMDSVDRWTTDGDLVSSSVGAHSWIVLRQTGIASNYEICFQLNSTGANNTGMTCMVSPAAGFTGGSTTARPTATDEIGAPRSSNGWGVTTNNSSYVIHGMQSTDGQVTYLFLCYNNVCSLLMGFARIKNPVAGLINPSYGFFESEIPISSNTNTEAADSTFLTTSNCVGAGATNAGMLLFMTTETASNTLLTDSQIVPNDFNGEYPMFPLGLASASVSNRGRHGQVFDMWIGLSSLLTGDTYPNDTSRQFAQFGTFIVPWNGSVVVTA